jgi:hypothetical protein
MLLLEKVCGMFESKYELTNRTKLSKLGAGKQQMENY